MILKGKGGIEYDLVTPPFAQGGEGEIYNINQQGDKVAKLYKQGTATSDQERKLIKMIMFPPGPDVLDQIAWPLDVLYQNGQAVGFVMRKFQLNEDLNVIYEYGASSKYPRITWGNKIHIAKNLCAVLNAVHEAGHVCGDLNPENISLNPNTGRVTFVDTDSYHITDGQNVYRCNVGKAEYVPPEIQAKMKNGYSLASAPLPTFGPETDNFTLAIHIFQLLMNGCHPFACAVIPSASSVVSPYIPDGILKGECPFFMNVQGKRIPTYAPAIDILPDGIQQLFKRAFIDGYNTPSDRPSAETWYYALDKLEKDLKKCPNVPHHEYFGNLPSCPWCEVDANYASMVSGGGQKLRLMQTAYVPIAAPPASTVRAAASTGSLVPASSLAGRTTAVRSPGSSARLGQKSRPSPRKKIRHTKGVVLFLALAVVMVTIGFGIKSFLVNGKIDAVNQMISSLPDTISDYSYFEQEIGDAYAAYTGLDVRQQSRVVNSEKLLACMKGFNSYQVGEVRRNLANVSEESVQSTNVLERLKQLSEKLIDEQRMMLTKEENQALEQASCAYDTIKGIEDLMDDIVGKYDTLPEIKKNYAMLPEEYKRLVYNASELETVEEKYQLEVALVFSEGGGGWAVSVKADAKGSLSGDIVIPSKHQGQPVVTIPEGAFSDCAGIRSLTVPDSVIAIGQGAFKGCIGLQSITLPFVGTSRSAFGEEGLFGYIFGKDSYSGGMQIQQVYHNSWGEYFYYPYIPNQLKEVTITNAVQLSYGAFDNCSMLAAIHLNNEIVGAETKVFRNCSGITTVNIPGILVISESMFEGCSALATLTLSESVMKIEKKAFKGCINLVSLNSELAGDFVIGNSVQFIGESAFSGCIQMQSIILPFVGTSRSASGTEGLFGYIFGKDSYSGGMQIQQVYNNGWGDFFCSLYIPNQLKEVTITDAVQLGYGTFNNCSMLSQITVNSSAKASVGDKAFENCVQPTWN